MNSSETVAILIALAIVCICAFILGSAFSFDNIRKEAISHHVAHYVVDDNGVTSFVWNDPSIEKKGN